jgi:hypothetical protein
VTSEILPPLEGDYEYYKLPIPIFYKAVEVNTTIFSSIKNNSDDNEHKDSKNYVLGTAVKYYLTF